MAPGAAVCPFDGTQLGGVLGTLLGDRYQLLSRLGAGAMGDVYLAEHVLLKKKMAVKVLKPELCRSEDLVRRFQQEAIAASRIGQENIVSITDFGRTDDGALYFVMEALSGQNLTGLIANGQPLPVERAVSILLQLSRALGAAHAKGIIHRDLKADNVMVVPRDDGSDLVKVLDFGISKMSSQEGENRATQAGLVIGTPAYMAPEQARGDVVDRRADIYSFGVVGYELVTGTVPFEASTLTGVLMKHISEAPQPPHVRRPGLPIPAALESLILRALEKDPEKRPQTMEAVRDELIAIAQNLGVAPRFTPGAMPKLSPVPPPERTPLDDALSATYIPKPGTALPALTPQGALAATLPPLVKPAEPQPALAKPTRIVRQGGGRGLWLGLGALTLVAAGVGVLEGPKLLQRAPPPQVAPAPAPVPVVPAPTPPAPTPAPAQPIATVTPPAEPVTPPAAPTVVTPEPEQAKAPAHVAHPRAKNLTEDEINRIFQRSGTKIRKCFLASGALLPKEPKTGLLQVTVAGSGEVTSATFQAPDLDGTPINGCIVDTVKQLKFPPHLAKTSSFELPLQYGPLH